MDTMIQLQSEGEASERDHKHADGESDSPQHLLQENTQVMACKIPTRSGMCTKFGTCMLLLLAARTTCQFTFGT